MNARHPDTVRINVGLPSLDRSGVRLGNPDVLPSVVGRTLVSEGFKAAVVEEPPLDVAASAIDEHLVVVSLSRRCGCEGTLDGLRAPANYRAGTTAIIPSGTASRWSHKGAGRMVHLFLQARWLDELASGAGLPGDRLDPEMLALDPDFRVIAEAVAAEAQRPRGQGRLVVEWLGLSVAVRLLTGGGHRGRRALLAALGRTGPHAGIDRSIDFIESNLAQGVSLAEMAAQAELSPFHFARAFKAKTGLPPHRYLMHRRVERAKELLRRTSVPVTEIALACGFASSQHFATMFKRAVGATPTDYRGRARP
ncbi:MAG: helix-turn-helix domain-containing protein [Inquilinaceae bacterium]